MRTWIPAVFQRSGDPHKQERQCELKALLSTLPLRKHLPEEDRKGNDNVN